MSIIALVPGGGHFPLEKNYGRASPTAAGALQRRGHPLRLVFKMPAVALGKLSQAEPAELVSATTHSSMARHVVATYHTQQLKKT